MPVCPPSSRSLGWPRAGLFQGPWPTSRGDTCFAAAVPLEAPGRYRVYNYSSPVDGPDLDWIAGQTQPTNIYAQTIALP